MMQRNKMIVATFSAVFLTSAIVGASYLLIPAKQSFSSQNLSSQTFGLILGASLFVAITVTVGILLITKRRTTTSEVMVTA
jgi:hypothetical protein